MLQKVNRSPVLSIENVQQAPTLQSCLRTLFGDRDTADVTMIVSENCDQLHAHKCILMCRSVVFKAMLSTPMQESATNKIVIPDCPTIVMKELLHYVYTGELNDKEILDHIALPLFGVAMKYELLGLVATCEDFLTRQLRDDNMLSVLNCADAYNAQHLKSIALQYIAQHPQTYQQRDDLPLFLHAQLREEVDQAIEQQQSITQTPHKKTVANNFNGMCIIN